MTSGNASVDIRELAPGHVVEVDTPNAAFTIEHSGYYRVNVNRDATSFITRRGGSATATPPGSQPVGVDPSEELMISGTQTDNLLTYVAPDLDGWDRWNYARTDQLLDSMSARYVSPDVYGARDLDDYGRWRVVPDYGPVWIPSAVGSDWAPYTTGTWIWDPLYSWTWVDTAPWGWVPFHYGRWVYVNGFWGWTPGPRVATPVYAPALVGFFWGGRRVSWVALGWGEPLCPWWGSPGFIGRAWWGGWRGPRIMNKEIVKDTTVVHINKSSYANVEVRNAVIATTEEEFGQRSAQYTRMSVAERQDLHPLEGALSVKHSVASLTPAVGRAPAPPREVFERSVVATRATPAIVRPTQSTDLKAGNVAVLQPRLVPPPPHEGSLSPEHLTSQLTPRAEHTMLLPRAGQTASVIKTPAPREPITPTSKGSEKLEIGGPPRTGEVPPLHPETVKPARTEDVEAQTGRSQVHAPSGAGQERLPSPPPPRFDDSWRQPMPRRLEKLPPSASPSLRFSTPRENGGAELPRSPVERAFPGVPAMQLHNFGSYAGHRR